MPELRLFRNDFARSGSALAVAPHRHALNHDAVGARVTVQTDTLRRTKVVQAGSGFLSQHSKELFFGLGESTRVTKLTVEWPGGASPGLSPSFRSIAVAHRGGRAPRVEAFRAPLALPPMPIAVAAAPTPDAELALRAVSGPRLLASRSFGRAALALLPARTARSRASLGHEAPASRAALEALQRRSADVGRAGLSTIAIALDPAEDVARVRAAASSRSLVPIAIASPEVAGSFAILGRHLFVSGRSSGCRWPFS